MEWRILLARKAIPVDWRIGLGNVDARGVGGVISGRLYLILRLRREDDGLRSQLFGISEGPIFLRKKAIFRETVSVGFRLGALMCEHSQRVMRSRKGGPVRRIDRKQ